MRWRGLAAAIEQGDRLLGYRGAIRPLHRGQKSAREASFPAFRAPAQTFRFPGPMECGVQLISILGGAEFLPLTPDRRKGFLL
jgi:hypothetical protein